MSFVFELLSAALIAAPLPATKKPPAQRANGEELPPREMIDFLGRRQRCDEYSDDAKMRPTPPQGSWEDWLGCGRIAAEEATFRTRYALDRDVLAWLNQTPSEFDLGQLILKGQHGPPLAIPHRLHQEGKDVEGKISWRLDVDANVDGGRTTSITFAQTGRSARTMHLSNARFPLIDPSSIKVYVGPDHPNHRTMINLRYGFERGWCDLGDPDNRAEVYIVVTPKTLSVYRQDRTNCGNESVELGEGEFTPPVRRR